MAMLDFGSVKYCNLVAAKQRNAYVTACCGVGRIFSWRGGGCTKGAVSIQVISGTCNGGLGVAKLLELLSLTNLPVYVIGKEQKKGLPCTSRA